MRPYDHYVTWPQLGFIDCSADPTVKLHAENTRNARGLPADSTQRAHWVRAEYRQVLERRVTHVNDEKHSELEVILWKFWSFGGSRNDEKEKHWGIALWKFWEFSVEAEWEVAKHYNFRREKHINILIVFSSFCFVLRTVRGLEWREMIVSWSRPDFCLNLTES